MPSQMFVYDLCSIVEFSESFPVTSTKASQSKHLERKPVGTWTTTTTPKQCDNRALELSFSLHSTSLRADAQLLCPGLIAPRMKETK